MATSVELVGRGRGLDSAAASGAGAGDTERLLPLSMPVSERTLPLATGPVPPSPDIASRAVASVQGSHYDVDADSIDKDPISEKATIITMIRLGWESTTLRPGDPILGHKVIEYPPDDPRLSYRGGVQNGKYHGRGMLVFRNGSGYKGDFKESLFDGFGVLYIHHDFGYIGCFQRGKREGFGTIVYLDRSNLTSQWRNDQAVGLGTFTISEMTSTFFHGTYQTINGVQGVKLKDVGQGAGPPLKNKEESMASVSLTTPFLGRPRAGSGESVASGVSMQAIGGGPVASVAPPSQPALSLAGGVPAAPPEFAPATAAVVRGSIDASGAAPPRIGPAADRVMDRLDGGSPPPDDTNMFTTDLSGIARIQWYATKDFPNTPFKNMPILNTSDPQVESYQGPLQDGKYHGMGRLIYKNGNVYCGQFHLGKFQGEGVLYVHQDYGYIGSFVAGNMHGHGVMTYADGSTLDSHWENGLPKGDGKLVNTNGTFSTINGQNVGHYIDRKQSHGPGPIGLNSAAAGNAYQPPGAQPEPIVLRALPPSENGGEGCCSGCCCQ